MPTVTKKDLIDRISEATGEKRSTVKKVVQQFLDTVIRELSVGNRLEFRDFGVFETRRRAPRVAQNPKTLERVPVPERNTVKFKVGRLMKMALTGELDADALARALATHRDDDDEDSAVRDGESPAARPHVK